jgi:hypothetical protein
MILKVKKKNQGIYFKDLYYKLFGFFTHEYVNILRIIALFCCHFLRKQVFKHISIKSH